MHDQLMQRLFLTLFTPGLVLSDAPAHSLPPRLLCVVWQQDCEDSEEQDGAEAANGAGMELAKQLAGRLLTVEVWVADGAVKLHVTPLGCGN